VPSVQSLFQPVQCNPCFPSDLAVYRSLVVFRAAGFPRSFDDLSIADGLQKALKMLD
jgi:hypothetical protein